MSSFKKLIKNYRKLRTEFAVLSNKCMNEVNIHDFNKVCGQSVKSRNKDMTNSMILTTEEIHKSRLRKEIVDTLIQTKYVKDNKWAQKVVIAFLHEALYYIKNEINLSDSFKSSFQKHIEEMYGVKPNRIKSQVALFIMNFERGNDKSDIRYYFTEYEILTLKYHNDIEKLQKAVEEGKVTNRELHLIDNLYNI